MVENKSAMLFASIYTNVLILLVSCEKRARETLATVPSFKPILGGGRPARNTDSNNGLLRCSRTDDNKLFCCSCVADCILKIFHSAYNRNSFLVVYS